MRRAPRPNARRHVEIFAIHGLPEKDRHPAEQLRPLREGLGIAPSSWHEYTWATPGFGTGRAMQRLQNREFGKYYAGQFETWFRNELTHIPTGTHLLVIAYSAGAFIFLRWLSDYATDIDIETISAAFCLAGPRRFRQPEQLFRLEDQPDDPPILVREEPLRLARMIRKLRPWQLGSLIARLDATIPRWNSAFPGRLAGSVVDQHTIWEARHKSLPSSPSAVSYVSTAL